MKSIVLSLQVRKEENNDNWHFVKISNILNKVLIVKWIYFLFFHFKWNVFFRLRVYLGSVYFSEIENFFVKNIVDKDKS